MSKAYNAIVDKTPNTIKYSIFVYLSNLFSCKAFTFWPFPAFRVRTRFVFITVPFAIQIRIADDALHADWLLRCKNCSRQKRLILPWSKIRRAIAKGWRAPPSQPRFG
jgi:hypothetical protein